MQFLPTPQLPETIKRFTSLIYISVAKIKPVRDQKASELKSEYKKGGLPPEKQLTPCHHVSPKSLISTYSCIQKLRYIMQSINSSMTVKMHEEVLYFQK